MAFQPRDRVVVIGGEAGQGMQTLGLLFARALIQNGVYTSTQQSYQSRIRGGHNTFHIRLASQPIHSMRSGIDLLIALDQNTLNAHCGELTTTGCVLFDASRLQSQTAICGEALPVDLKTLFSEAQKMEVLVNSLYLGMLAELFSLPLAWFEETLTHAFGKKGAEILAINLRAAQVGAANIAGQPAWKARFVLPETTRSARGLTLHGNQAIALGAAAAGCQFYTAYPMTPSTSVLDTMAEFSQTMPLLVEQAEDEVAALNMVLGASFAGARSMTGTSGGGFALMVEALSLAGITECPAVIVNAQRPGPATGLPTRTEQGDLEFIIHAGHGEFPRLVLAPGTHAECFELTWRAFNWADVFQIPVILLTDQYLADWYTNVENFEINKVERDFGKVTAPDSEYVRYRLVEDGISPRAIPGTGSGVVIVDSDEHTEDGHLTEDLSVRVAMNEKRLRKLTALRESMLMPEISGTAKKNLVITWGSTRGAALDAAEILTSQGRELSVMHMKQLWPLHGDKLREIFKDYDNIIVVEGNATGQLARLLQAETSREFPKRVLRYDGLPFLCDTLAKDLVPLLI